MKKLFTLGVLVAAWTTAFACTNFLVGKNASVDGSTIISYAADSYSFYGYLHFQPAADHPQGSVRAIKEWDTGKPLGSIPEVAHTYSVVGNTNEHQLTIGETTWGGREELYDTVGIDYGSLIYIALERCSTAREAIECVTSLVREYGYASEGESFSFGDPNEIWIMDMIGRGPGEKGAVWVATRIPDDCIAAHANQARTQGIPAPTKAAARKAKKTGYVDTGDVLYSADIIQFARKKGLFEGKDSEFSFQKAFNPYDFSGLLACEARVWSFYRHFSSDMDRYLPFASGQTYLATGGKDAGEAMPLYIRPDVRKVDRRSKHTYLSGSNFLHLYDFAVALHGRNMPPETTAQELEARFNSQSLEYQLSGINRAKSFSRYLNALGCFYTDRPVDYEMVTAFTSEQALQIAPLEHERWVREHQAMGWRSGSDYETLPLARDDKQARQALREQLRCHKLAMDGEPTDDEIRAHFFSLPEEDQDKDWKPFNSMLKLLKKFDGLRIYRL